MNGEELGERFGEIRAGMTHLTEKVSALGDRLESHIEGEERRLKHIEEQLSLGRFIWLMLKAVGLTFALLLTFKVGDIGPLWKALFK